MTARFMAPIHEPAPALIPIPSPTPRLRVLVVDDEAQIRNLCTVALIHHGFEADAVGDGAEAWDALKLNTYQLLVTDNNMPKVTGVELIKKVNHPQVVFNFNVTASTSNTSARPPRVTSWFAPTSASRSAASLRISAPSS